MINSRDINQLHPVVAAKAGAFVAACKAAGIAVLIYSTYRDHESQDAIYAQGRTEPGPKVTNAKGGQSYHQYRCAFDFVPTINSVAQWNDRKAYAKCGAIAEALGFEWGGRWTSPDMPHCQFTGGLSLADLRAGKEIPCKP
jgi:peptidoglycan L-alanyl-D-glutamate endopeptidase CwlK